MEEILKFINKATYDELQDIMNTIEKRYKTAYPDWDVVYIAVPTDPVLRRKNLEGIIKLLDKDIQWHTEQAKKDSLG